MPLSWNEIRIRAVQFAERWKDETSESAEKQTFWNEFFAIFGIDRKSVAIYEKAVDRLGRAKGFIDLFWPGEFVVEHKSLGEPLDPAFDQAADYLLTVSPAEHPRYIITSDFQTFRLYDLEAKGDRDVWEFGLKDLSKNIDKFGFIAGYKKQEVFEEDPVNRKAAERMAELHDQLKATGYVGHDLEVLLVRLLFCLFAEDGHIFEKSQFHNFIYDRTDIDGSDIGAQLSNLFEALNTPKDKRQTNLDEAIAAFPYVNGNLFGERIATPSFDHKMRDRILNAAHDINWSEISPAIFGAMFQGVMDPKQRRSLGAHYTSEQNILKVIKPLFLDNLWVEFEKVKEHRQQLIDFHDRLAKLTFLDPACGCGNFLVVSYREIRRLEIEILKVLYTIPGMNMKELELDLAAVSKCNVDQFYGIEIEEFPAQIAQVALWLTDIQMNNEASDYFGKSLIRLPLVHSPTIVQKDALEIDWADLIPSTKLDYLFGNPPFSGGKLMSQKQRDQIVDLFPEKSGAGVLDFVAGWYAKAIKYIQGTDIKVAFVSTNSISQGEQVSILWKHLFEYGAKINFAHRTFKWGNEASGKAAVYCVIIGFWLKDAPQKWLFDYADISGEPHALSAKNVNPYLMDGLDILVKKRTQPISDVPEIKFGNQPIDGGNLLLSEEEYKDVIKKEPTIQPYIRQYMGSEELINRLTRYCLWLKDASPSVLKSSPFIMDRLEKVRSFRLTSTRKVTRELSKTPSLFAFISHTNSEYIAIPSVSSENRRYIPMVFNGPEIIASNLCLIIPYATSYHFGILESEMHMTWMRNVAGRLKSDYRYSNSLVYNTFPWPEASKDQIGEISKLTQSVLDARAKYSSSSLAELYGVLTMPADLLKAHQALDNAVDKLYRVEKFESDTARMQYLLELYQRYSK